MVREGKRPTGVVPEWRGGGRGFASALFKCLTLVIHGELGFRSPMGDFDVRYGVAATY